MEWHEIIGFVAGFSTTFAAAPDVLAMLKRRSSQGMNPTMAGIVGTWPTCGLQINRSPLLSRNSLPT
jgi:uncharacterized protein with PQ loop repeat